MSTGNFYNTDNIKQQLLPFVLDPSNKINRDNIGSGPGESTEGTPQIFSFRTKDNKEDKQGLINIFPDVRDQFNLDIGTQLLLNKYLKDLGKEEGGGGGVSLKRILNYLPGIQIREYTQQTRLESLLSLIKYASKGFTAGEDVSENYDTKVLDESVFKNTAIGAAMAKRLKQEGFWSGVIDKIGSAISGDYNTNTVYEKTPRNQIVINLVHFLYYNLLGSVTTNIYTIPNTTTNYLDSNGKDGWPVHAGGFGDISVKDANTFVGKMIGFLGGNVKIVTEPIWNASFDSGGTKIDITLNLFNDTYEHALNNYLFVNTIIPSNMPLQYGIWQMPPSVYDIKIEGGNRLYMCKGSFTCQNKGVLRLPSKKFLTELCKNHLNNYENHPCPKSLTPDTIIKHRLVTIPDVYELKLSFESMLPNNINTYLEQFANNNSMSKDTKVIDPMANDAEVVKYITTEHNTISSDFNKKKTTQGTLEEAIELGEKLVKDENSGGVTSDATKEKNKKAENKKAENKKVESGPVGGSNRQSAGGNINLTPN